MEEVVGSGAAEDATVDTTAAVAAEDSAAAVAEADRRVEAAERKVEKQLEHLEGAKISLAEAVAARDALNGGSL